VSLTVYRNDGTPKETDYLAAPSALDTWHDVGHPGEIAWGPNGFSSFGDTVDGSYEPVGFRKDPWGWVRFKGLLYNPAAPPGGTAVFTLPVGYRPLKRITFDTSLGGSIQARLDIDAAGVVTIQTNWPAAAFMAFESLAFDTKGVTQQVVPVGQGPPLVTALPAVPTDGQEVYFLADATNGVVWHLRYRAGSASAYKWECVGGSPLHARVDTQVTLSNQTWALLSGGPSIVWPLSGDYMVRFGATVESAAQNRTYVSMNTTDADSASAAQGSPAGQSQGASVEREVRFPGQVAAATMAMYSRNAIAAASTFEKRWVSAMPVRVG
jgi:hypothetical protein